jgi:hypothetical protein
VIEFLTEELYIGHKHITKLNHSESIMNNTNTKQLPVKSAIKKKCN